MLPKSFKIGTQVWSITERNPKEDFQLSDDTFGYTLERENLIIIDKSLVPSRKRQVLFHEILHAIRFTFVKRPTFKKTDDFDSIEHFFIELYEEPVLMLLKDNPELLQYLTS